MDYDVIDKDADTVAQDALRRLPPEKRQAAYEMAKTRHRTAWRNLFAGSAVLVIAMAATMWIAAAI